MSNERHGSEDRCLMRGTWVDTSDGHRGQITSSWRVGGATHYTVELEATGFCVPYRGDQVTPRGAPLPPRQPAAAPPPADRGFGAANFPPASRVAAPPSSPSPARLAGGALATAARCYWESCCTALNSTGPDAALAMQNLVMLGRFRKDRLATMAGRRIEELFGFAVERPGDDTPGPRAA